MSKRKRRGSRRRQGNGFWRPIKLGLAATVLLGTVAGTVFFVQGSLGEEKPDPETFCYNRANQHVSAIFIDNSLSQLSEAQLRDFDIAFERAYDATPANGKLLFFTTAAHTSNSQADPVFEVCKPAATIKEQAALNAPEKPAPYLAKQAEKAKVVYEEASDRVLQEVQDTGKQAKDSPILEQLRAISRNPDFERASSRSLTVITDGLENSHGTGYFCVDPGAMPPFEQFKQKLNYSLSLKPNSFQGTHVNLLLVETGVLPSPPYLMHCTTNELRQWWLDYFTANGASVDLTPLRHW
jgi:hypothetical protein